MQKVYYGINDINSDDQSIIMTGDYLFTNQDYMTMLNAELVDPLQGIGYMEVIMNKLGAPYKFNVYFQNITSIYDVYNQFMDAIQKYNKGQSSDLIFNVEVMISDNQLIFNNIRNQIFEIYFYGNIINYFTQDSYDKQPQSEQQIEISHYIKVDSTTVERRITFAQILFDEFYFIKCDQLDSSLVSYTVDKEQNRKQSCNSNILCALSRSNNFVYNSKQIDIHNRITAQPPFKFYIVNQNGQVVKNIKFIIHVQFFRKEFFRENPRSLHLKKQMFVILDRNVQTVIANQQFSHVAINNCSGNIGKSLLLDSRSDTFYVVYKPTENGKILFREVHLLNYFDFYEYIKKQIDDQFLVMFVNWLNYIQIQIFKDKKPVIEFSLETQPVLCIKMKFVKLQQRLQIIFDENFVLNKYCSDLKWKQIDNCWKVQKKQLQMMYPELELSDDFVNNGILGSAIQQKDDPKKYKVTGYVFANSEQKRIDLRNFDQLKLVQQLIYEIKIKEVNQTVEILQDEGELLMQQKKFGFQWFDLNTNNVLHFDYVLHYLNYINKWFTLEHKEEHNQFPRILVQLYLK